MPNLSLKRLPPYPSAVVCRVKMMTVPVSSFSHTPSGWIVRFNPALGKSVVVKFGLNGLPCPAFPGLIPVQLNLFGLYAGASGQKQGKGNAK